MPTMKGEAYASAASIRRRAALNIACDDGHTEFLIADENDVQGHDPGTGRSVDAGGVSYTHYYDGTKVSEASDGMLAYDDLFPYSNFVFEAKGKFKVVQTGDAVLLPGPAPGFYHLTFDVLVL